MSNEKKTTNEDTLHVKIIRNSKKNSLLRRQETALDSSKKSFKIKIYNKKTNTNVYILDIDVYLFRWKTQENNIWHITDINYEETIFDKGDVKLDIYLNQDATYLSGSRKRSVFFMQFNMKNKANYAIRSAFCIHLTNKSDSTFDLFLSAPQPYKTLCDDIKEMFNNKSYDIEILSKSYVYYPAVP